MMNKQDSTKANRIAFWSVIAFSAFMGFVLGIPRADPTVNQDSYWWPDGFFVPAEERDYCIGAA